MKFFDKMPFFCALFMVHNVYSNPELMPKSLSISFAQAMEPNKQFNLKEIVLRSHWKSIINSYTQFIVKNPCYSQSSRIPKIIHQIWLGNDPLPKQEKIYGKTWQKYNPDWEYKLWTDKDIDEFVLENKALYDATTNYGEKSDIARYEILYRIGGLYVDTDFECLQSFDIFHHCCDFYTGCAYADVKDPSFLYNGLIGSIPGHPILKACIEQLHQKTVTKEDANTIFKRTGPAFFSQNFQREFRKVSGITIAFPVTYFYPWPNYYRYQDCNERRKWIRPESFAIHHWHLSWNKERTLSEKNNRVD